jgi:CDP-glucose 4,6-dehydratase
MKSSFWKRKKVLITGHTGFKGSWLSIWLQSLGVDLIGFSKSIPTKPSLFEIADVQSGMISIMGNICDFEHIKQVVQEHKPEIIIHMAAQSLVRESYNNPIDTYSTNVIGTINLLESVRIAAKNRIVINVTSDKCYENLESNKSFQEDDPMGGFDPYSSSKGCAELITSAYRNSFFNIQQFYKHGIAIASVRAGNVIGGGDWSKDRLIPDVMNSLLSGHDLKIRNPDAIRPWQHVLEPLSGYLLLAEKLNKDGMKYSGAWNFGPSENDVKPVSWVIKKLSQYFDTINYSVDTDQKPHEDTYLRLDCSKARNFLGWIPRTNLEIAIKWTAEWYKQFEQKTDLRAFTEKQIQEFTLLKI